MKIYDCRHIANLTLKISQLFPLLENISKFRYRNASKNYEDQWQYTSKQPK